MTDSTTPNYGWSYPTVNGDADTWGTTVNATFIAIDAALFTVSGVASAAQPGNAKLSAYAAQTWSANAFPYWTSTSALGSGTFGAGLTFSGGSLAANVTTVAGRAGAVTLSTDDISGLQTSAKHPSTSTTVSDPQVALANTATDGHIPMFSGATGTVIDNGLSQSNVATLSGNLSGIGSASAARGNLGVTATGADTTYMYRASNGSDVGSATTFRTNIGLGRHTTSKQTFSGSSIYSEAHGLGALPDDATVDIYIQCTTADGGYAVGDRVRVNYGGSSRSDGVTPWCNDSNVGWSVGNNGVFLMLKTGGGPSGSVTPSNWTMYAVLRTQS